MFRYLLQLSLAVSLSTGAVAAAEPVVSQADLAMQKAQQAYAKDDIPAMYIEVRRACDLGNGNGCLWAGNIAKSEYHAAATRDMAPAHFSAGCQLKSGEACNQLGQSITEGWNPAGPSAAINAFDAACVLKSLEGCMFLGEMYTGAYGGAKDLQVAQFVFDRACQLGEKKGCERRDLLTSADAVVSANQPSEVAQQEQMTLRMTQFEPAMASGSAALKRANEMLAADMRAQRCNSLREASRHLNEAKPSIQAAIDYGRPSQYASLQESVRVAEKALTSVSSAITSIERRLAADC